MVLFLTLTLLQDTVAAPVRVSLDTVALASTVPGSPTPNVRIPGFVVTTRGTLLLFAEGRIGGGDPGSPNPIAMLLTRSTDGGHTWSRPAVLSSDGAYDYANPTPLVDRVTGSIWLAYDRYPDRCGANADCNVPGVDPRDSLRTQIPWVRESRDDGLTWSTPKQLPKPLHTADGIWWRSGAVGPGSGIQLQHQSDASRNGRLVIPARRIGSARADGKGEGGEPFIFFSDDHGATWWLGGITAGAGANEPEVAELPDGRLLMDGRQNSGTHRWRWWSSDGGITWGNVAPGDVTITPVDASMLLLRDGRLAFTGPIGPGRSQLGLWLSRDGGQTFSLRDTLAAGFAAYSVVQQLPDGALGVVYEATPATEIRFLRVEHF